MEDLVIKNAALDYFSGRATPLQKQAIEAWLKNPSNHEQYYQWLHDWELRHLQAAVEWRGAFDKTRHRVDQNSREEVPSSPEAKNIHWRHTYLRPMAAAVFLFALLGLSIYMIRENIFYKTSKAAYGETKQITLPDGSRVSLNANSSVRYPRFGFGQRTRQIELSGEADFEIERTPNHRQFIVSTATGLKITVLGTEFTVFARSRGSQVILRTGKVALQTTQVPEEQPIVMNPGDIVAVGTDGKLSRSHTARPEHYSSWKDQMITLDRTSLREIAAILEDTYGFPIELEDPALGNKTATGLLPIQDADTALELIADMFDISFTCQGNKVIFKD